MLPRAYCKPREEGEAQLEKSVEKKQCETKTRSCEVARALCNRRLQLLGSARMRRLVAASLNRGLWLNRGLSSASTLPRTTMDGVNNDYSGVLSSLSVYFNALHLRDSSQLRKVWDPSCHMFCPSGDGGVVDIGAETFFKIVEGKTAVAGAEMGTSGQPLADTVHSVQFSSPDTVLAKVQVSLGESIYTDFLTLLKLDSGWRIVAKLFNSRHEQLVYSVDTTPIDTSHAELGRVAAEYVGARRAADAARLAALFHPCCQIFTERDGELINLERSSFLADISTFGGPRWEMSALTSRRFDRVVSIDKSGPDTAVIKLHVGSTDVIGDARLLTDLLLCVRVGGGWRVVTRIYTPRWMPSTDS